MASIERSGVDWVYSLVAAIGPNGIRHCSGPPFPGVPDAEHHVPPSGWLYRREVALSVGDWADPAALPWQIDFDYMRRAALAGARFACHTRPTALKFPSSLFPDGYRSGEPAPIQRSYFSRIQSNPEALELEILRELAARFAQLDRGSGKGIFDRRRPGAAAGDHAVVPGDRGREEFQERRLGRLHLRGLAQASALGQPEHDARMAVREEQPQNGDIQERFALRKARRDRRERRRQRKAT